MPVYKNQNGEIMSADCFVVKYRNIEIFRITHSHSATILWASEDAAMRYLRKQIQPDYRPVTAGNAMSA